MHGFFLSFNLFYCRTYDLNDLLVILFTILDLLLYATLRLSTWKLAAIWFLWQRRTEVRYVFKIKCLLKMLMKYNYFFFQLCKSSLSKSNWKGKKYQWNLRDLLRKVILKMFLLIYFQIIDDKTSDTSDKI